MPEEMTKEYTMANWKEATEGLTFVPQSVDRDMGNTISLNCSLPEPVETYGRSDFERDLSKVVRKVKK